jgi:DNA-binding NarL/FixJ family response regulator
MHRADGDLLMDRPLRVVLADDHYVVRAGVEALLRDAPGVEVVGLAANGNELLAEVERARPDAVLTDIRMPHRTEGIHAALAIRARWPDVGVVVLSQHLEEPYVRALFAQGSAGLGYLLKERVGQRDELVDALRRTARGESVLDRRVVDLLIGPVQPRLLDALTSRERDVLAAMATGGSNPSIAGRLHLSLSSVEKHVTAIFLKLGVADGTEIHRRVAAVVAYLGETTSGLPHGQRGSRPGT